MAQKSVTDEELFAAILRLADDHLILGQRLSEWCGHAPSLEEDLALSNIALDILGTARALFDWAGQVEGKGRDEDKLAFLRTERDYTNLLITEQPNHDFAFTIYRQLAFSLFMREFWIRACTLSETKLSEIAGKAVKEATYHVRHCAEWVIRLGDGTELSRQKLQEAMAEAEPFLGEFFEIDALTDKLIKAGFIPDFDDIKSRWITEMADILSQANLEMPDIETRQTGGRKGLHGEDMGYLLAELQFMQRAYPDMNW